MGHKSVLIRETIAYILTRDDPKWANWDLFMYENTERKPMILLGTLNGECLCIALCVCVLHFTNIVIILFIYIHMCATTVRKT